MGVGEVEERASGWRRLSKRKLLAIVLIFVVLVCLLVWVVIPYVQELFKYERLDLRAYWWTVNQEGNISMVTLRLRNNGTKTLTISEVYINQTQVDPSDWGCRTPNARYSPRTSPWMYIAPQSMVFKEDATYNLTIGTEAGNLFSYIVKAEDNGNMGPELFNIKDAGFSDFRPYGGPIYAYLGVENHHDTLQVVVVERWVNGTSYDGRLWIREGTAGPKWLSITFEFNWVEGVAYNFTLRTAPGNIYNLTVIAED